jgi:hypothetical protein
VRELRFSLSSSLQLAREEVDGGFVGIGPTAPHRGASTLRRGPARVLNEADFAAAFVRHRDLAAANPMYLEQVLSRTMMPDGTTDCFTAFM